MGVLHLLADVAQGVDLGAQVVNVGVEVCAEYNESLRELLCFKVRGI